MQALFDSGSEINAITPAYAKQLDLWTQKTDVGPQNIDGSLLTIYEMVIAIF